MLEPRPQSTCFEGTRTTTFRGAVWFEDFEPVPGSTSAPPATMSVMRAVILPSDWSLGAVGWLVALLLASAVVLIVVLMLDNATTIAIRSWLRASHRRRSFLIGALASAAGGAILAFAAGAAVGSQLVIAVVAGAVGGFVWSVRPGGR